MERTNSSLSLSINRGYLISLILTITLASTQFGINLPLSGKIYGYMFPNTSLLKLDVYDQQENNISQYVFTLAFPFGGILGGIIFSLFISLTEFKIGPRQYMMAINYINSGLLFLLTLALMYWGSRDQDELSQFYNSSPCQSVRLVQTIMFAFEFVQGILSAFFIVLVPLYLKQLSPRQKRGACVSTFQLMITIGNSISSVISLLINKIQPKPSHCFEIDLTLIAIIYTPMVISIIQNLLFQYLIKNESPMFLAIKNKDFLKSIEDQNSNIKSFINEAHVSVNVNANENNMSLMENKKKKIFAEVYKIYKYPKRIKKEIENIKFQCTNYEGRFVSFCQLLKEPKGKAFLIGVLLIIFQQMTGINFVMTSFNYLYSDSVIQHAMFQISFFLFNFFGALLCILFIDRIGRKRFLQVTSISTIITLILLTFISFYHTKEYPSWVIASVLILYVFAFGSGPGPVVWIYIVETVPPLGLSFIVIVHWIFASLNIFLSQIVKVHDGFTKYFLLICTFSSAVLIIYPITQMVETMKKREATINSLIQGKTDENMNVRDNLEINQNETE